MIRILKRVGCIFFLALSVHGFADLKSCCFKKQTNQIASEPNKFQPLLEIRGGYFFFSASKMRKIYNKGGGAVGLSGSCPVWKWLQIYGSAEYMERHGKSLGGHQKAKIWEVPISLGLKPVISICQKVQFYLTLGPRYFFVHTHANSSYVNKTLNRNGLGGFANMGFNFFPCRHLLLDVFGEYSYKRIHFHPSKHNTYGQAVQIGGFTFGAGIGYAF